jgi:hypothetical protein
MDGTTDPYWNADTLLEAFQRMVRRQDYWRGYVGYDDDAPTDDEVFGWLQDARDALAERKRA